MTLETKGNAHEGEGSVKKEETRPQKATSAEAEKSVNKRKGANHGT